MMRRTAHVSDDSILLPLEVRFIKARGDDPLHATAPHACHVNLA